MLDDMVILKDFEVLACHGVNPEEKVNKQRFLFTVKVELDFFEAAKSDDVSKTVSYSAIKKLVKAFAENNCFDLIETLAVRLAEEILLAFPLAKSVEIELKKPDAPMSGKFDYAAVKVKRSRHKVYAALGSSIGDRKGYLDFAIKKLKEDKRISGVRESGRIVTEPYGGVAKEEFLNSAAAFDTLYSPFGLLELFHSIESEAGRKRDTHFADRTLDMDIIFYDDEIIETDELCVPHIDMQNRFFVLKPLSELCPNKLHPVLKKRVIELLHAVL